MLCAGAEDDMYKGETSDAGYSWHTMDWDYNMNGYVREVDVKVEDDYLVDIAIRCWSPEW